MKHTKIYLAYLIIVLAGLSLFNVQCKKDTETVTVTVKGKALTGAVKYPDFTGTLVAAKGAVVYLYTGTSATGTPTSTTFADASGNYAFPYLLPGAYFITSKYNTDNQNYKDINGINFTTNPGYEVTMGSADMTQDITLVNFVATSTLKISLDTVSNPGFRPVTWEIHSKCDFNFPDHAAGSHLPGGFNSFTVDKFAFDGANPANTKISGYVLLSSITTLEPIRDDLYNGGCVPKTLLVNLDSINLVPVPETDTARFTSTSVERYGDGYIAHGTLLAFYHHGPGAIYPPDTTIKVYEGGFVTDTVSVPQQYWNTRISKPCDLYFTYAGKYVWSKNTDGSTKNLYFGLEGEFTIYPQADYYISSSHISDGDVKVNVHVGFLGALNDTNYPE